MENVYITGHKNPDLDSICSAMAYAILKNKIDPANHYIGVRCGHLSDNVKGILEAVKIPAPPYMSNVYPKAGDVVLTSEKHLQATDSLRELASTFEVSGPSVIPVYDGEHFYGLLSTDDIISWLMTEMSTADGIDTYPLVKDIMSPQEEPLYATELYEDAMQKVSMAKKRGLPVFDQNGYMGFVTRRCFLRAPKYNVILMDHNEKRQSITGIEEANIKEIIDHHRIDAVKTELPIFIDAEPLGSTCTIVYQLFLRHGLIPGREAAKILLTGIVSDTLILKSPTTTQIDIDAANALADIYGVNLEEFGLFMFSNTPGLRSRDPKQAITSDFKTYNQKGINLGIGQCEVTTLHDLKDYTDLYLQTLENVKENNGLDWAVLMITDILREHSVLLCTNYKMNMHLQYRQLHENVYDMPGILSRKKQLLPELLSVIDMYL